MGHRRGTGVGSEGWPGLLSYRTTELPSGEFFESWIALQNRWVGFNRVNEADLQSDKNHITSFSFLFLIFVFFFLRFRVND